MKRTEDGAEVSVYSMATTVNNDPNAKQQTQDGIKVDYAYTANEPRQFKSNTPSLTRLGVDDFDNVQKIIDLQFTFP
jgi:hypothetical protein